MKSLNPETLGRNIARFRKIARWTQKEMGERLHVDQAMIARWEKGKVLPRPQTIDKMADLFGVSTDELISSSQEEPLKIAGPVEDPELLQLLTAINLLGENERHALKTVLKAMLTQARLQDVMKLPGSSAA